MITTSQQIDYGHVLQRRANTGVLAHVYHLELPYSKPKSTSKYAEYVDCI